MGFHSLLQGIFATKRWTVSPSLQVDSLLSVKYKWLGKGECQLYPTFFVEKRAGGSLPPKGFGGNNKRLWKAAQHEPWRGWGVSCSCEGNGQVLGQRKLELAGREALQERCPGGSSWQHLAEVPLTLSMMLWGVGLLHEATPFGKPPSQEKASCWWLLWN